MIKTICLFASCLHACCVFAQKSAVNHSTTLGTHFSLLDFKNTSLFSPPSRMDAGLSLSYLRGMSSHLDWEAVLTGAFPDSTAANQSPAHTKTLLLQASLSLRLRPLQAGWPVQPFFLTGLGASHHKQNTAPFLLFGTGIEWNYKDVYFLLNLQYRQSFTTLLNSHYFYSIGIAGLLNKARKEKQANPPLPVQQAVTQKTVAKDRDGDGLVDSVDVCPDIPGLDLFGGCPDTDGDGIPDKDDVCPQQFGVKKYKGCPVPDSDGDGMNDEVDKCPREPGVKENAGCPLPPKNITEQVNAAAKNIFFETGRFTLLPASFATLDGLARLLAENSQVRITIEGHTDNIGSASGNLTLSKNRAEAVAVYLIGKGIDPARLTATGYGMERPVADNSTEQGRAANRRVEIKIQKAVEH